MPTKRSVHTRHQRKRPARIPNPMELQSAVSDHGNNHRHDFGNHNDHHHDNDNDHNDHDYNYDDHHHDNNYDDHNCDDDHDHHNYDDHHNYISNFRWFRTSWWRQMNLKTCQKIPNVFPIDFVSCLLGSSLELAIWSDQYGLNLSEFQLPCGDAKLLPVYYNLLPPLLIYIRGSPLGGAKYFASPKNDC